MSATSSKPLVKKIVFQDIFFYFCIGFVVAVGSLIGISVYGYQMIQREVQAQELQSASRTMNHQINTLKHLTGIYGHWSDAYERIVQKFDESWSETNIGKDLNDNFGYDLVAIVNDRRVPIAIYENGNVVSEARKITLSAKISQLAQQAHQQSKNPKDVEKLAAQLDEGYALVSSAQILKDNHEGQGSGWYLLVAQKLGDRLIENMSKTTNLKDIAIVSPDEGQKAASKLPIEADGSVLAYLTWTQSDEAKNVFWAIIPPGLIAILVLSVIGVFISRHVVKAAKGYEKVLDDLMVNAASLTQAKASAETSNEAKLKFLAMVGHEIRTPMNGIVGILSLLKETEMNNKQQNYVDTMQKSADTLTRMIEDVMEFTKLQSNQVQLKIQKCYVRETVKEVQSLLEPIAIQKKIGFFVEFSDDVPRMIMADPIRLRQILFQLVTNALKFTKEGYVKIYVSTRALRGNNHELSFRVSDTGVGVPKPLRESLFNDFFQVDPSMSRPYGGPGLGLSLARSLVILMGGKIGLNPDLDEGSEFWFKLPVEMVATDSNLTKKNHQALRLSLFASHQGESIIQSMGDELGLEIDVAPEPEALIDISGKGQNDLIVLDILNDPEQIYNCIELTRAIRSLPGRGNVIPIIAIVDEVTPEDQQHLVEAGVDTFLFQPLSARKLSQNIKILLKQERIA